MEHLPEDIVVRIFSIFTCVTPSLFIFAADHFCAVATSMMKPTPVERGSTHRVEDACDKTLILAPPNAEIGRAHTETGSDSHRQRPRRPSTECQRKPKNGPGGCWATKAPQRLSHNSTHTTGRPGAGGRGAGLPPVGTPAARRGDGAGLGRDCAAAVAGAALDSRRSGERGGRHRRSGRGGGGNASGGSRRALSSGVAELLLQCPEARVRAR